MQGTALAWALGTGRARILSDAYVHRIRVDDKTGRACGVSYIDTNTGARLHLASRTVFICCGAVETARLMLNSRSRRHPDGLGNSSGWLGRGLMDHPVVSVAGRLESDDVVQGYDWSARQRGLMIPPAIGRNAGVRPFGIWLTLQRTVDGPYATGYIDAQGEMLPYWENRVSLAEEPDRWGVRTVHIECGYYGHEKRLYDEMRKALLEVAAAVDMRITSMSESLSAPGLNSHEMGTARLGDDPSSSVIDRFNRCWDCPNVFVTDGAAFPAGGWQNPTLTIMAMSARAAALAAEGLLAREGVQRGA
jgi:choline dehydrogenase-like flavoprotein